VMAVTAVCVNVVFFPTDISQAQGNLIGSSSFEVQ
jgi:hypothetical protein